MRGMSSFAVVVSVLAVVIGAWWWTTTVGGGVEQPHRLIITGSSTVAPLIVEIAKRFEATHEGILVDVQTGGSSRGIADVRQDLADIGMVSRALKSDESDLFAYPIALDGVGIIVNATNPIGSLSRRELMSVYTGTINDWAGLGSDAGPITVVNKADGRSTLEVFLNYVQLASRQIAADVVIGDNEQAIKIVTGNQGAIGYVSIGAALYHQNNGLPIKLLPLDGEAPTIENVSRGEYDVVRTLNLVTRKEPSGMTASFLDFSRSAEVDDLVKAQFFISMPE